MQKQKKYKILKFKSRNKYKELVLTDTSSFDLTYSACVDKENRVFQKQANLFVECKNGDAEIYPTYCLKDKISIGGLSIELLVKEITDENELRSYQSLANFHYKGHTLFGRTSILVAVNNTPYLPKVIGYIELATPFYVNKPRAEILNTPFNHNGISWQAWDKETTKKYINTIVRIARVVVYPEFRGVGLGRILIQHAEKFARDRWQITQLKPLFLEISADMLKYVPFAEKAGMHYIGETEGNLNRIHTDLSYLLLNYRRFLDGEIVSEKQMGIVEQQKSRLRKAVKIAEDAGITVEELLDKLKYLQKKRTLRDFTFFQGLVSLPKPTYLKGLDQKAEKFLQTQVAGLQKPKTDFYSKLGVEPINTPLVLDKVNISYRSHTRKTNTAQAVYNAFSISPTDMESPVIHNLSLTIQPSEIVFITGTSGSGKTSLLNMLAGKLSTVDGCTVTGTFLLPENRKTGIFKEIVSAKPLVEIFGKQDVNFALQLMGTVGLSDAYVYLKKYQELSKGQQFRAQLAQTLLGRCNLLIIDEFCSHLDPVTSNVIAFRLRILAKKLGITLIVAGAHSDNFIHSLSPDTVLRLSTAWDYEVMDGKQFLQSYAVKHHPLHLQTLNVKDIQLDGFIMGKVSVFIQKGKPKLRPGFTIFESNKRYITGYIKAITEKRICDLSPLDAGNGGFDSLKQMKFWIKRNLPGMSESSTLSLYTLSLLDFSK